MSSLSSSSIFTIKAADAPFGPVGFGSVCTRGGFREANKGNGSPKSALTNQRKGFSKIYLVVLYFTDPSLIRSTRFIAMQFHGQK